MAPRRYARSANLRSIEDTAFYPQFSPKPEAPYIMSLSAPSLPYAAKAFSAGASRDAAEDIERTIRKKKHCEVASQERAKLEQGWKAQREQLEQKRKQEAIDSTRRKYADRAKREARWTQKTAAHPFSEDQWQKDEQIYDLNRVNDAKHRERQRLAGNAVVQDNTRRRNSAVADVDMLVILRKEKKKLQEDQKELKARLDLDKVDKRCASAKFKADMIFDGHQEMLASKGHLDRSHSDFFSDHRGTPSEVREKRKRELCMQRFTAL